jgi:hypothetical protein
VSFVARHLLPTVVIGVAVTLMAGFFAFARPQYQPPNQGEQIKVPPEHPATAGWTWAEGTPGFEPGTMLGKHHDFNITGVQPVEIAAAQLAAAHSVLDAKGVRVLDSLRTDKTGPVAILAAPTTGESPTHTCLAVMLRGGVPVTWRCPQDLLGTHVLGAVVAARFSSGSAHPLFVMGVASADVKRIVLVGGPPGSGLVYTRGTTWGQFEASTPPRKSVTLLVYGDHGLLQKLTLGDPPGGQRLFD